MYVRVTRMHIEPSGVGAAVALIPETVAAIRRLPGCRHAHVGVDRASGEAIGISTYDTAEHAGFSRDEALAQAVARLRDAGTRFEPAEVYEEVE